MTKHQHDRNHPHHHSRGGDAPAAGGSKPKTIVVVGVVLMLVALVFYVLSVDESLAPGEGGEEMRAAE